MDGKDTALVVSGGDEPVWLRVGYCPTLNLHHFYESTDLTLAERPSSVTRASEPVSDALQLDVRCLRSEELFVANALRAPPPTVSHIE